MVEIPACRFSRDIWSYRCPCQIGRTKVFLRAGQMAELDARRTDVRNKAARAVQSRFRTHFARAKFLVIRKTSISFQSFVRGKVFFCKCKQCSYPRLYHIWEYLICCSNTGLQVTCFPEKTNCSAAYTEKLPLLSCTELLFWSTLFSHYVADRTKGAWCL
jgi:hypothetical protein